MSLVTVTTPLSAQTMDERIPANWSNGNGFTLSDPGTYRLSAEEPWYYHASDEQAIGDMTAVAAHEVVTIQVTDSVVTKYIKTQPPYVARIAVSFQEQQERLSVNSVVKLEGAGAPTSGASGTGDNVAGPGSTYHDYTNGDLYLQTGLITSPTWKLVQRVSANNIVRLEGDGAPTSGASGTGDNVAGPGSQYHDYTNGDIYVQTGLITAPEWKIVARSGRLAQKRILNTGAKIGAGAGWALGAAANTALLGTVPASQTAATLVIPIPGLKVGDVITAFHLIGQIESGGEAVTVDAELRKHTAVAADVSDALVASMTQLSVIADTAMGSANTSKSAIAETVGADETFYLLLTVTTLADTDVALQGIAITVTEA